jgi:flagellar biosynthesis protein FlhB
LRLIQAAGLIAALTSLPSCLRATWLSGSAEIQRVLREQAAAPDGVAAVLGSLPELTRAVPRAVLAPLLPLLLAVASTVLIVGLLQTRGALVPLPARSPRRGVWTASMAVVSTAALVTLMVVHIASALGDWRDPESVEPLAAGVSPARLLSVLQETGWSCAALLLGLGALDAWWVRRSWRKRHTLEARELRREARQREVAPEARAAQRRAHRELSAS